MILLVYGEREKLPLTEITKYLDIFTEVIQSGSPERIHNELAEKRPFICALVIQEGMPETSLMIGDCLENQRKIPVIKTNGNNLQELLL